MISRRVLSEFTELVLDDRKICHNIARFCLRTCLNRTCKCSDHWV